MNLTETKAVLAILYSSTGKSVPESVVHLWASKLGKVPRELGMMAADRMFRTTRIYGEPQFADYREHVNHLHREAKRALKPQASLCSAAMAHMSAKDREAYQERHRKPEIGPEQAKRLIAALELEAKRIPAGKSQAAINAERGRQTKMIEGLREASARADQTEGGPAAVIQFPVKEKLDVLLNRVPSPEKTPEELEASRQRQKELLATMKAENQQETA